MSTATDTIEQLATQEYKYGFETLIDADTFPPGLNEDVVKAISLKKHEPSGCSSGASRRSRRGRG